MDTKKAVKLAKAVQKHINQAVCITQKVWDYGTEVKSLYQFTYFDTLDECQVLEFSSFKAVEEFVYGKWNISDPKRRKTDVLQS